MRVPRSNFTNKLNTWLVLFFLLIFIAVLVVPIELTRMSVHAQNNNRAPQQPYQTFDTRQIAELNELYGKWQSGEQFAEEEKLILQRWGVGLPLSELEGRVVISRVLFERYVANKELTLEDEGLLSEFESYRRAAGRLIEDERVRVKQERSAQQEASQSTGSPLVPAAIPANDNCSGAIGITDTGSYPITTATVDAVSASTTGDPLFSCATVDDTIWYTFIPGQTSTYTITTCNAGTGSSDTVLGVFTASGVCSGFTQVAGGCSDTDFSCASNTESSTVNPVLAAGVTYYIVVGRSNFLPGAPTSVPIQLSISRAPSPVNDTCAGATPLALDIPLGGTTFAANKDYQLSGASCFTGIGQSAVVADGRDVVYSFNPPATDDYSFRVTGLKNTNSDLVLYVMTSCPGPSTISCDNSSGPAIVAANRSFGTTAEEVMCVPLVGGQTYYLVVDEQQQSDGSAFTVEVNQCRREVEPNDLPGTAGTGIEGSIGSGTDVDFYQLGAPAAGARLFALLDGVAANSSDFDMRVTTATNTLEYDDKEADSQFGSLAPVIAGTPLTGVASYLRINHNSGTLASEPYRLYSQIQAAGATPLAACPSLTTSATAETEANNTAASADTLPNNCQPPKICYYASGSIGSADADYYSFSAMAGELIILAVDGNPCRDGTVSAFNPALELRDSLDAQLIRVNDTNSGLTCPAGTSVCTAQPGLTATAPNSAAEALVYRARTTGTYYAKVSQGASSTGNYLLSISLNKTVIPVQPAISISDVSQAEGNSGTSSFIFTVSLSAATSQTVTVQYATTNGAATAGPDYQSTSGTLTFSPGQTSKPVTILVNGETTFEANETFLVNLMVPTNAIFADTQGVGTIVNDDAQPTISINDITQGEGNSGTAAFTLTVGLSAASSQTVTVNYATANGTATAGTDYQSTSGTLTFNAGETSKPATVLVNGDALNEANETFLVNLTVPTNATINDNQGVGTITNDDAVSALSINDVGVTEGNSGTVNASFTVSLSAASGQTVTVQYATANGTATAGSDYQSASGTLTFNAGETSKPVTVVVNGDTAFETDETFTVNLTVPTNATIADSQGVGTIVNDDAQPTLSINDISQGEGNSGTTPFTFTVGLSAASSQTVTVNYATANGTATVVSDYQSASGTLTFAAGETSKPITVLVNGDALNEANETFLVNLSVPTNATVIDSQGVGTIANDDPVPALSINDVGVTEGNSGTVSAGFTVSLSAASGQTVTVQYATADGTAMAGSDYQSASGTLTFNPGETSKPVTVLANGDTTFEANETFLVNLTVPTNATITDNQGVGTIVNDDAQPTISINDITQGEGNSGTTPFTFTVGLSAASSQTVTVNYATANGTATVVSDYQSASGTLTFAAGETSKPITVLVNGDSVNEANETFLVNLTVPSNASIADNQGVGTIVNDDAVPSLSINDVGVTEGNSGTVSAGFTVSLSAASGQTVTVNYATADGTATAGSDYQSTSGTLTFNAGETSKPVTVLVTGDTAFEANETFLVNLTVPTNATIGDGQGVGTIANDDTVPSLSINDVSLSEGNIGPTLYTFTVGLSAASSQTVTVNYATADGTATAGSDYQSTSGTLTFNAGEMSKPVTVLVNGDALNEANETFFVNLTVPANASIADSQGVGTIVNDDAVPALSINDVGVTEGNSGTVSAGFTVSLSAASGQTVTVQYATVDATATAGSDYQSASGTLTFNAGETTKPVSVLVNGDTTFEADETFLLNLTVPTNATIGDGQGVGTIANDDTQPTISINDVSQGEGNSATTSFSFTVSLSAASSQTVTVNYTTADGTATAGSDYQSGSGTVTFNAGETTRPVTVLVNGDNVNEANETFFVNLTIPTNATIIDNQGLGTITNDDAVPSLSINDVGVTEGNSGTVSAGFTVSLSAASGQAVTVQYATADGTAVAGTDYQATSGTLTFNAGETTKSVTVLVNGDNVNELNETFVVNLTNPGNATVADNQGVGTIANDDAQPTISINDVSQGEGNSGTTSFTFTASLSAVSSQTVTVNYATANGTASAGNDYQSASGIVTFNAGETSKPLTVLVNGDTLNEANETFFVNLTVPTNATISDGQGLGTITNDDGVPSLSINDVGVTEGNSGTVSANFTVSLSAASGQIVTVQYATANGTANAGPDYQSASGTLTFNAGEISKPVTVLVNGDNVNETNETFLVNLTVPTNASISDNQGIGTILNDDGAPTLSVNDISQGEGNSGTTSFTFTVTLSPASGQTVTVNYATADGTATAGSDYQSTSGTLTFNAGETSKPVTVLVNGDTLNEANETLLVNLTVPTNATIIDSQGVGTITNDDAVPALSINDAGVTEGNSGAVSANFTVSLSAVSGQTVTVQYATADGTATAGSDYQNTSGTLTFNAGETSKPLTVLVNGDTTFEADETFLVNLAVPTNATIGDSQGLGTILNDDGVPTLSINDISQGEGNSGTTSFTFTVGLSAASSQTVTVNYATANGTAMAGSDYQSASGTLTFNAGETSKPVTVLVNGDTLNEANETFLVNLTVPTNATISDNQGVGTIVNDDAVPALSINDVGVTEGNSGTVSAGFTVSLSAASGQAVTVQYATADGTATAGSDYQSASGTLTFNAGETSKPVTVLVNGDNVNEPNETFLMNLTIPTNATIGDSQGLGTILNDDAVPSLSINDVTMSEGNSGTTSFTFSVGLSAASSQTVTVNYATANGTATAGSDYQSTSGTLTFNAGETSKPITVLVNGDTLNEPNETFLVNLTVPTNATISDNQGVGTITNDDGVPSLSINDVGVTEGNSGTVSAGFTVSLSAASGQTVTVQYATADGTATAGSDYQSASGTLTFNAGETSKPVTVLVNGDNVNETNETFLVNLTVPTNATIADNQGVGTILNDDGVPTLSINDISQGEGNSGTTSFTFAVALSAASSQTVTVNYATANGTGTAGSDYQSASGMVTFNAGETSKPLTVLVNGDTLNEANETFFVNLTVPTNATIGDGQGAGTITNDDAVPALSINDVGVTEGNSGTVSAGFTVSLSAASGQTVTVQYATANGTATAGSDYQSASGTLTFNPGETSKPITVLVNGDTAFETNETFLVNLTVPTNATIGDGQGVGTIANDDAQPTISINDISQAEGNSGTTSFTFTVSLSAASSQTVTVNYATADGTATAGSDYQSGSGTVTFNPGEMTKPITVLVNGDLVNEANETFFVNLSNAGNATISDSQGLGTITNDEGMPSLSINDVGITEGNSGTVSAGFTVSLSAASGQAVTVNYATANGTATAGSDYQSTSGALTFNAGETSKPVTVLVNGDTTFETNETFLVNLTVPTNATIGDGQGVGTIANDDTQPTISINDVSQGEGNSGTTPFTFTVGLSVASSQTVTVNYATANGTATVVSDYQSASATLTFAAGETSKPVTVLVNGDALNEANETFFVNLSNATNASISDSQGVGTITNDDAVPSLSINDVGVTEGNSGTVSAGFTVSLSAASGQTVTVQYATADGTATAGSDYQSTSGTLTFNAGETSKPVTVLVNGDNVNEANETFLVNLTVPTNATMADSQGVGTILNDDGAPTLSINDMSQGEGNSGTTSYTFTASLLPASDQTVTVNYATADGTATAGSDYQSTSGTLTFNAGETSKPVTVLANGDVLNEANETFLVNLIIPTNASISDSQGVGTIVNDDAVPALSINDVGVTEGNSGTVSAGFTVSLSAASGQTVTVQYATANGTATAGPDYQSASGTLTFNAGETSKPVTVLVNGDTAFEANETFLVNLTVPTNATIADNQGVGTIANDDAQPPANAVQFTATTASVTETVNATMKVDLVVTRSGDSLSVATVDYASADGTASERSDYLAALGTLRFAAGETAKSIRVFIVDDVFGEGAETFSVKLSNPVGVALGAPSSVTVTINSNESVNGLNPVKDASFSSDFFVRQHYVDFFNREADAGGLAFWKNQIDECVTQECREVRRINVSAAFFISIEFQQTGYLVYKANQAAFNSGEFLKLREFLPDLQEIGRGVVIGQPGADAQLEANKQKFFLAFVQRAKFVDAAAYPTTMTAAQFVDKLNANTFDPLNPGAGALTQTQRDALVGQLSAGPASPTLRAQVLRSMSENVVFSARQFNKAFVLMQYFGYLRRNPNDPPEIGLDFAGYNFWLGKLNQFNGNFINAEMVKAFILSGEYQQRFGP